MGIWGRTAVIPCDTWRSLFPPGVLLNLPPSLLTCLGIGDGQHLWNAITKAVCVCRWSGSRAWLGSINSLSAPSPLLLQSLQLLLVTSHSLTNYVHMDCLASTRHLAKGFSCNASFSPLLTASCLLLCSLDEPASACGWPGLTHFRPSLTSPQISPAHSIETYGFYCSA